MGKKWFIFFNLDDFIIFALTGNNWSEVLKLTVLYFPLTLSSRIWASSWIDGGGGVACHEWRRRRRHSVHHCWDTCGCYRGIWSLLVLLMASSLFLLVYFHVERYASRPFVTIVNAHVRDSLPFPAVTICNLNQFHRERVPRNDPRVVDLLRNLSAIKSLAKVVDLPPVPRDQFPLTGERLMEIAVNASHKLNDLFMSV